MTEEITNSDDLIDSRDVIARIEELREERSGLNDALEAAQEAYDGAMKAKAEAVEELDKDGSDALRLLEKASDAVDQAEIVRDAAYDELATWDNDYGDELKALEALAKDAEGYASDWQYGATLIRDSYFEDYAEQLADELGLIQGDAHWPNNCIDWERAARELQMDYTSVDFDGVEYWVRS